MKNLEKWSRTSNTSERLKEAMRIANMKQTDLARATGLGKGGISNYVIGRYEPKSNIISILAEALNVDPVWLMGYDVPMERKQSSPDKQELTEGEKLVLELFRKIPEERQPEALELLQVALKMQKKL